MNYKVTNLSKDERKFIDRNGSYVFVEAGKTVITMNPPKESNIWKIQTHIEKTEENKIQKEVISKVKTKMLSDK